MIPGIGSYGKTGNFIPARVELGVVIAICVVLLVFVMLKWSRFGRNLYAVGGNSQSALMLGINVKRTRFFSYLLCGILSGIGGYVYLLHTGAGNASNASAAEMQAIAAAIIGGTLLTGRRGERHRHDVWRTLAQDDQQHRHRVGAKGAVLAEHHDGTHAVLLHPLAERNPRDPRERAACAETDRTACKTSGIVKGRNP